MVVISAKSVLKTLQKSPPIKYIAILSIFMLLFGVYTTASQTTTVPTTTICYVWLFGTCIFGGPITTTTMNYTTTVNYTTTTAPQLSSQLSITPNPVTIGNSVTITADWSGGTPPYTATLYVSSSDSCSGSASSGIFAGTSETYGYTPSAPGTYFCFVVTDSLSQSSQSGPIYVSVSSGPTSSTTYPTTTISNSLLSSSISSSASSVNQNQSVTIYADWSGGTPPYTATLSSGHTNACSESSASASGFTGTSDTYSSTPTSPGEYYCFAVTDSSGQSSQSGPIFISVLTGGPSTIPTTTISPPSNSPTRGSVGDVINKIIKYLLGRGNGGPNPGPNSTTTISPTTYTTTINATANYSLSLSIGAQTNGKTATVNGTASTSNPNAYINQFSISWGDGSNSAGPFLPQSHTYLANGAYTITATATDTTNASDSVSMSILIASIFSNGNPGCPPGTTQLSEGICSYVPVGAICSYIFYPGRNYLPCVQYPSFGKCPNGAINPGYPYPCTSCPDGSTVTGVSEKCPAPGTTCSNGGIPPGCTTCGPDTHLDANGFCACDNDAINPSTGCNLCDWRGTTITVGSSAEQCPSSECINGAVNPGAVPGEGCDKCGDGSIPPLGGDCITCPNGATALSGCNTCSDGSSVTLHTDNNCNNDCTNGGTIASACALCTNGATVLSTCLSCPSLSSPGDHTGNNCANSCINGAQTPGCVLCPDGISLGDHVGRNCNNACANIDGTASGATLASGCAACPDGSAPYDHVGDTCTNPLTGNTINPTCNNGESLLPTGVCGCTDGIPNAQNGCTACPDDTGPVLNAGTGQYYCASIGNPPSCSDAVSYQECICSDGTTVTGPSQCTVTSTCDDGNPAPNTGCVTCSDGSTASSLNNCPVTSTIEGGGGGTGGGGGCNDGGTVCDIWSCNFDFVRCIEAQV